MNKYNFKNRIAVVTGGAQGFGLAITKRIIQSDGKVVIWDIWIYVDCKYFIFYIWFFWR